MGFGSAGVCMVACMTPSNISNESSRSGNVCHNPKFVFKNEVYYCKLCLIMYACCYSKRIECIASGLESRVKHEPPQEQHSRSWWNWRSGSGSAPKGDVVSN